MSIPVVEEVREGTSSAVLDEVSAEETIPVVDEVGEGTRVPAVNEASNESLEQPA